MSRGEKHCDLHRCQSQNNIREMIGEVNEKDNQFANDTVNRQEIEVKTVGKVFDDHR